MRVAVFSTKPYDQQSFGHANDTLRARGEAGHDLFFFEPRLTAATAALAGGFGAVCAFVNDDLSGPVIERLARGGVRAIALRSAGYNHVDLDAARRVAIHVVRVPAYSPHAVAEHTIGLMLTLNRKIYRAYNRVREGNFALEGLLGFDLRGRTAGVVGTGKIGQIVAKILRGFDCRLLAFDPFPSDDCRALGVEYVDLPRLLRDSDIVTLHCPLTPHTRYMIGSDALERMKDGVMLINTSRGALVDTRAVIEALKTKKVGYLGLDVYEEEADLFFEDLSSQVIHDDVFSRLLTFPNVVITGHQAFFTADALGNIADTTLGNLTDLERSGTCVNEVSLSSGEAR